jgi:hypothetical protein
MTTALNNSLTQADLSVNIPKIWNTVLPAGTTSSLYGSDPQVSLLTYIVSSTSTMNGVVLTTAQRSLLMNSVVSLVKSDAQVASFFTKLFLVSIDTTATPNAASLSVAVSTLNTYMLDSSANLNKAAVATLFNSAFKFSTLNNTSSLVSPFTNANVTPDLLATAFRNTFFSTTGYQVLPGVTFPTATSNPVSSATMSLSAQSDSIMISLLFFYRALDINAVSVALNSGTLVSPVYTAPGFWLTLLTPTLPIANTKYPVNLILGMVYIHPSYNYSTGVLTGTVTRELITGEKAAAFGYDDKSILAYIGNPTDAI